MCAYNYLKEIPKATLFEVYAVQCWYISDEFDKKIYYKITFVNSTTHIVHKFENKSDPDFVWGLLNKVYKLVSF